LRIELERIRLTPVKVLRRVSRVSVLASNGGRIMLLHLTNTGKLQDIIYEGATVLAVLRKASKTDGVVVGAPAGDGASLLDTRIQASCFEKACAGGCISWLRPYGILDREYPVGGSRLDYLIGSPDGRRGVMELKSAVYMDGDGVAMYPDTVSIRGREHIRLLTKLPKRFRRVLVFIAAHPDARIFRPCHEADPIIRDLLITAVGSGVEVRAVKMAIYGDGVVCLVDDNLPITL
jgi:sugar fermentation stimulation protein A